MVERAVILSDGNTLKWSDFEMTVAGDSVPSGLSQDTPQNWDLEDIEKQTILKALEKSGHNKSKAAELLNISWQSLDRRMKKHKIVNREL
jgi:transcriptional regulator with PAS, ATPase and Fis domain